ncbi:hypothetical protein [Streptomyces sp. NPDC052179]
MKKLPPCPSMQGAAFIGVLALDWRSRPTAEAPFVDAGLLHERR